mgnify:FL=1
MFVVKRKHYVIIITIFFSLFLYNCSLKSPDKVHGINFLKNRSSVLEVDKSNKNDVIKNIGKPHSISINNDDTWIYFERMISRTNNIKTLGKNVLVINNILELKFDKYGILKQKKFYDKNDIQKVKYSKDITENTVSQPSFVEKFLSSIKQKMYRNK